MKKIKSKIIIDPELEKWIESGGIEDLKTYLTKELGNSLKEEANKIMEEEMNKLLFGDGGYDLNLKSVPLLDFNSMHPSMWVDYSKALKPKNHYERMMQRRRNGTQRW